MKEGDRLTKELEQTTYLKPELESLITQRSNELAEILGVTVAYEPYAYADDVKLYSPYYDKKQEKMLFLGELYDYTNPSLETSSWYRAVRDTNKSVWVEPYYGQAAQALVADYGIPFYYVNGPKKGQFKGMVAFTISLKGFTALIHSLSLGKTGYGLVSSQKGEILAHPVTEYIGLATLEDLKEKESREDIKFAYDQMMKAATGQVRFNDKEKKQESLFFYDKVPASNWSIGVLFFVEDLLGKDKLLKRKYINISLVGSLLAFCLLGVFFNRDFLSVKEIWTLSLFGTFVLICNVVLIGFLQHKEKDSSLMSHSPPVTDTVTLNSVVNSQNQKTEQMQISPSVQIPTGIYIEELEFEDSYNVNISGRIWQKYDTIAMKNVRVGFKFPQASPFAESTFVEESFRKQIDGYVLIQSQFRITARMNFKYANYPFDKQNINLEIQPLSSQDNLLFVPDLQSYTYTNPSRKSGMSPNIDLSGSDILESYFSYDYFTYETNFGHKNSVAFEEVPELHYNIKLKRVLITAFVTYLIPIFVTLIMIFIMIFSTSKSKERIVDSGIVQGMAAFFFVLIFSHIDLRKNIDTAELIYMEYFYFVTYAMIILSTYNLITYAKNSNKLFDYKDNLIVKSTFWPMFLGLVLIITLATFY
jgi:hypothetical protein